ncbi:MAG: hypothetical protein ACFFG0_50650 [Candidatus Thorarchaeota archaeon]
MRKYTVDRWNFSDKTGKWVYVTKDKNGKRKYIYQLEPPPEFVELSTQIKEINEKILATKNQDEIERLYDKMMKISKKMQTMRMEK